MVDHNAIDSLMHGPNSKLFWGGGVAIGLVIIYEYRKSRLNAATAAPVPTDSGTTGYADTSGSYGDYGSDTAGLFSYTDPASGTVVSGAGSTVVTGPSTNAQWSQQVQGLLVTEGYSSVDVAAAIGHYIVGTTMTSQQWEIVQAGIALEGQPPQPVPAPHIVPAGGQTNSVPADGYYQVIPAKTVYQVRGGKVYGVGPATWAAMKPKPALKTITKNDPVLKLPYGGNI